MIPIVDRAGLENKQKVCTDKGKMPVDSVGEGPDYLA